MSDDPLIAQKEEAELDAHRSERAANLFDVRRIIGGLFAIYGLILTILGIGASDADIEQAAGINVNLWVGLAMLLVAAIFLGWAFTRPLSRELDGDGDDGSTRGAHAPTGPDAAAFAGSETKSRRSRSDREGARRAGGAGPQQRED